MTKQQPHTQAQKLEANIRQCLSYAENFKCSFSTAIDDMGNEEAPPEWLTKALRDYNDFAGGIDFSESNSERLGFDNGSQ